MQLSLREVLLAVVVICFGLTALSQGGIFAYSIFLVALFAFMAIAIIANVGRGSQKILAVGFLVPVLTYTTIIVSTGTANLDPYNGELPINKILRPIRERFVAREYYDTDLGVVIPKDSPRVTGGIGGAIGPSVGVRETPDRHTFMALVHVLLATGMGYIGSKFAFWIAGNQTSQQRSDDEPSDAPKTPPVGREFES